LSALSSAHAFADRINGQVLGAGAPIVGSRVTLWAAGTGAPQQLAQTQTGADGGFVLDADGKGAILYLVAKGGRPAASNVTGENPALALMAVLGSSPPGKVVVNELTTVASAFAAARFIGGEAISGNPLGLRIAAGNVPNLVDPVTGNRGKVLLDPLNSSMTTTMANLDTLASLHGRERRLAWPFPQGSDATQRGDAEDHARSDGRHRPRAVGRTEGTLRAV